MSKSNCTVRPKHDKNETLTARLQPSTVTPGFSVMILGPAGCGKTTVWKTLMACHNRGEAKPSTVAETVNPKVSKATDGG